MGGGCRRDARARRPAAALTRSSTRSYRASAASGEFAFILNILRKATGEDITPTMVETTVPLSATFAEFARGPVTESGANALGLRTADLQLPFKNANDAMWRYFEPELKRRMEQLEIDESASAKVRAALVTLLPSGRSGVDDVAAELHTSPRTLQRQLADEGMTFRKQLNHVRLLLSEQYLSSSSMTLDSIAFMLGYAEVNSFIRAFTMWTGKSPTEFRKGE
ncbi:helix-turn-helix domain-containing protein [Bifidobacterium choerinum]|nr:AraC family transcriptional regulator [Bifidobacterium choerinum]